MDIYPSVLRNKKKVFQEHNGKLNGPIWHTEGGNGMLTTKSLESLSNHLPSGRTSSLDFLQLKSLSLSDGFYCNFFWHDFHAFIEVLPSVGLIVNCFKKTFY